MYNDGSMYTCEHYYWDNDENEFIINARWMFEANYPDMPDYWMLKDVELVSACPSNAPMPDDDVIWASVLNDGVNIETMQEEYYE